MNFNNFMGKNVVNLPILNETNHTKVMKKVILNKQLEEEEKKSKLKSEEQLLNAQGFMKMGETAIKNDFDSIRVEKGEAPPPLPIKDQNQENLEKMFLATKNMEKNMPYFGLANMGSNKSINSKMVEIDELIDSPTKSESKKNILISPNLAFRQMRSGGNVIVIKSCVEGKDARKVFGQLVRLIQPGI